MSINHKRTKNQVKMLHQRSDEWVYFTIVYGPSMATTARSQ